MMQYSEEEVTRALLLTENGIDSFIDDIRSEFFPNLEDQETQKKFQVFNQLCRSSYDTMKFQFNETFRDEGERYFEHLREVAKIITKMKGSNRNQVIIALLHDAIEDIALFNFGTIQALTKDPKIAIAVQAISKNPWQEYLLDGESEHLNKAQAKERRNKEYFGHMENIESFEKQISDIADHHNVLLSSDEISEVARNAIQVKLADRIHNLSTQWDPNNTEKVIRKIEETEKHFYNIAEEFDPEILSTLKSHILALKIKLEKYPQRVSSVL